MTSAPRRLSKTAMMASTPHYNAQDVAEARQNVDIVKVIAQTKNLMAVGDDFLGVCPFHSGREASLLVTRKTRAYRCLCCGAKGDAVSWLRETQQLSFAEAIEHIRCARMRIEKTRAQIQKAKGG